MRNLLPILLTIFCVHNIRSQYGVEGAIYAAFDVGITWTEMNHLKKISETQDQIVVYSSIIAAESLAITAIDDRILKGQSELKPIVEELKSIVRISITAEKLVDYQSRIMNIVQETPALIGFASTSQFKILSDAGYILADLYIYTTQGKENLMSNKDRIDIINATQAGLDELTLRSIKLYDFLDMASKLNFDTELPPVDISVPMREIQQEIQTIINE